MTTTRNISSSSLVQPPFDDFLVGGRSICATRRTASAVETFCEGFAFDFGGRLPRCTGADDGAVDGPVDRPEDGAAVGAAGATEADDAVVAGGMGMCAPSMLRSGSCGGALLVEECCSARCCARRTVRSGGGGWSLRCNFNGSGRFGDEISACVIMGGCAGRI